jgi:GT2 family glycosyltransferase
MVVSCKVGIVLLNWNGWQDTCACLQSLSRLYSHDFEVVVVDNASTDDSPSHIRNAFPDITILETGRNLGFAGGCNVGMRYLLDRGCDLFWLLNNDTSVESDALQALVDKARNDKRLGAIGSAIHSADNGNHLQAWGGGYINFWLGRSRHFVSPVPDQSLEFITGASLMIRREAIEDIGLLDEHFFMYWEDADYCFRLRAAGWRLGVAGDSHIRHKGSASVGKGSANMDRYFNASAARFFEKHARTPGIAVWTGAALRIGKRMLLGDFQRAKAVWAGINQVSES